jgi:hypothetical protein
MGSYGISDFVYKRAAAAGIRSTSLPRHNSFFACNAPALKNIDNGD